MVDNQSIPKIHIWLSVTIFSCPGLLLRTQILSLPYNILVTDIKVNDGRKSAIYDRVGPSEFD